MGTFTDIREVGKAFDLLPGTYTTEKYGNAYFTLEILPLAREVSIVVGANQKHRCASFFKKKDLQKMINDLQVVCDAMEDCW
jgi:hypothetical protein